MLHSHINANKELKFQDSEAIGSVKHPMHDSWWGVRVKRLKPVRKENNITNWLIYSNSRARLTRLVNKQDEHISRRGQ